MSLRPASNCVAFGFLLLCSFLFPSHLSAQLVRTGYTAITAVSSGKCLDIYGESSGAGARAIQWHCNFQANEQWTVQRYENGFQIVEQQSGYCLTAGGRTRSAITQEPCGNSSSRLWSINVRGKNFQLESRSSGQCASIQGNSQNDAADVVLARCSDSANFLWTFLSGLITASQTSVLEAEHSGQCLDAGAIITQNPCGRGGTEQWKVIPTGGSYQVVSQSSGLCLSDSGIGGIGGVLTQRTCKANDRSSRWNFKAKDGAYEVTAEDTGYCMDVGSASLAANAAVIAWTCSGSKNQLFSLSAAQIPSRWTGVIPLPVNPIAVGNLSSGDLVMWSADSSFNFEGDIGTRNGQTYTSVFNPTTLTASRILVTNTGDDMFCPGTANLFNGNILVNGGSSSPKTSLYNPVTGLWTADALMNIPRGYEGDTVLQNGSVFTIGGSWSGGHGGKNGEVWTQGKGWRLLPGVPPTNILGTDPQGVYRSDNHTWLFSAPNGQVFHAGPSAKMNWITTTGSGSITSAGLRGDDPYAIAGNAVLYDVGTILKTGGASAYTNGNAEANTYLIDINKGTAGVTVEKLAPMAYPRVFANGVILPNGQVVIVGGQTFSHPFSDATAVLVPEIWDPLTHVFRQLAPMQTPRVYHSTGILLNDGRVYAGGGGQCGANCAANHFDAEILTPPYLLDADGSAAARPVISWSSSTVALGDSITATTTSPVVSFVLMRLSSVTHTVNNDQRRIPLQIESTTANSYTLSVPSNPGVVLPGNYWLFALDSQGVPSMAANLVVQLP